MDDFFKYFEKLELVAFFSAYPLIYFIAKSISSGTKGVRQSWTKKLPFFLPRAYALTVLLYSGMKINELIPFNRSIFNFNFTNIYFYLKGWAFLGIVFGFPIMNTKIKWTLIHSIPFVLLIIYDFFNYYNHKIEIEVIHNEMQLYFLSTLLNIVTLSMVTLYFSLRNKK